MPMRSAGRAHPNARPIPTPHSRTPTRAVQILYCCLTVALLDYLHDAWFYWTHRLLHWGPLYRHVHYIHHK